MEFALFLFFLVFSVCLTGVLCYFSDLLFFHKKEVYDREEITDIWRPSLEKVLDVFESGGEIFIGGLLFFGAAILAWGFSLMGGIIGEPHYANSPGNYFFQSPLLFFGFLFGYSILKEGFDSPGPMRVIFDGGRSILSGLGLGTWSANLAAWGLFHELYFLFVLFSGILILTPLCYIWNGRDFFGIMIGPKARTPVMESWDDLETEDSTLRQTDDDSPSFDDFDIK
jgi:hypothetical protein